MILLEPCAIALITPLEAAPGQFIASLGVVIEQTRVSQKYYKAGSRGVWGQLNPGPGFGALMACGQFHAAPTEAELAKVLAPYGKPELRAPTLLSRWSSPLDEILGITAEIAAANLAAEQALEEDEAAAALRQAEEFLRRSRA